MQQVQQAFSISSMAGMDATFIAVAGDLFWIVNSLTYGNFAAHQRDFERQACLLKLIDVVFFMLRVVAVC